MTGTHKIFFNAAAVYGRFVCAIVCGVFSGRWMLALFGERDYGLIGVIGSLVATASFFNIVLQLAAGRQLSYYVGRYGNEESEDGLTECRKWFGSAFFLHAVLSVGLLLIAFPIGRMAIREWLTIPQPRMNDCLVFYSYSCVQLFISMVTTPFNSMFSARQRIAELSVYSIGSILSMFLILWHMVSTPGDWFVGYAIWSNASAVFFCGVVTVRALMLFPECRVGFSHMFSMRRSLAILRIAFWQTFEMSAYVSRTHGVTILVNKLFGPVYNASFGVSSTVLNHASSMSQSLGQAFFPAMINLEGAGRHEEMVEKMYIYCKMSAAAYGLLVLPLILELDYVLKLWLVNPPSFAGSLCLLLLIALFFDCATSGFGAAAIAVNRLGKFYGFIGVSGILMLALMCMSVKFCGVGFVSMFVVMCCVRIVAVLASVKLADDVIGFGLTAWCKRVLVPFAAATVVSAAVALPVRIFSEQSFMRLCVTTMSSVSSFSFCVWLIALSESERRAVQKTFASVLGKVFRTKEGR